MRVVTIERFGRLTPEFKGHDGYIYEGDAWLLRFIVQSPEHFFANELENLCDVLDIDERQIYQMALYGDGHGLYDARLHISFEDDPGPPTNEQIERLRLTVTTSSLCDYEDDELDSRFREFLKSAAPVIKSKVEKALQQEKLDASKETQSG